MFPFLQQNPLLVYHSHVVKHMYRYLCKIPNEEDTWATTFRVFFLCKHWKRRNNRTCTISTVLLKHDCSMHILNERWDISQLLYCVDMYDRLSSRDESYALLFYLSILHSKRSMDCADLYTCAHCWNLGVIIAKSEDRLFVSTRSCVAQKSKQEIEHVDWELLMRNDLRGPYN